MRRIYDRVCGLDVHRDTVVACVRVTGANGETQQEIITWASNTCELLALRDWLKTWGVTHVAMESTGEYWKPVYYVLESDFTVLLVNAAHIKNVPGRKTDARMLNGSRNCWSADFCGGALCRRRKSATCGI